MVMFCDSYSVEPDCNSRYDKKPFICPFCAVINLLICSMYCI